jgi:hypothetical protein
LARWSREGAEEAAESSRLVKRRRVRFIGLDRTTEDTAKRPAPSLG